jgi:hypothetical protein
MKCIKPAARSLNIMNRVSYKSFISCGGFNKLLCSLVYEVLTAVEKMYDFGGWII